MKLQLTFLITLLFISFGYGQEVEAGTYPGICLGESITLQGEIIEVPLGADDYCTNWLLPDGTAVPGMTVTVSPLVTEEYIFEVNFNNGDLVQDIAVVNVCTFNIHPVDEDYTNAADAGKTLIWTQMNDNTYPTKVKTSKANKPAQTLDKQVHITVHMTPANTQTGKIIYFRVVDPDLDDESPYESGSAGNDNKDLANKVGTLSATSNVTQQRTINGQTVAAAEVILTITNRYAGDNYQVEASLDPSFSDPDLLIKTSKLVAWKRIYVEEDNMYLSGATLTANFSPDADALNNDIILIDNSADFFPGTTIELFDKNGVVTPSQVISKTANSLTIQDLNTSFTRYSGVRIIGVPITYTIPHHLFPRGYGTDANGTDGGTFVEYSWGFSGSQSVPKYREFPSITVAAEYCNHWFDNSGGGNNVFQLVATAKGFGGVYGANIPGTTSCFIAIENFAFGNNDDAKSESAVHEFGHAHRATNSHVDASLGVLNHEGTDKCNMSYDRVRDNGIVEFDTDCIYDIRNSISPL